jgi:hypothetical protein
MNREDLIAYLTNYELEFFREHDSLAVHAETMAFFAEGGYFTWTDEQLQKKYDLLTIED